MSEELLFTLTSERARRVATGFTPPKQDNAQIDPE